MDAKAILNKLKSVMPRQRREISAADPYEDAHFLFQAVIATPHDVYAAKELNQEICRFVADLPYAKRMILLLSLNGIPQEEIAQRLNMTRSAVGTNLARIKDRLAELLGVPEQRERGLQRGADSNDEKEADARGFNPFACTLRTKSRTRLPASPRSSALIRSRSSSSVRPPLVTCEPTKH
ncbi:RNA polymerase sigma factor [Streptomyces umbrinus]|uniref:RNA polymerase sigma factor n=1 Tax=Streptomyces umbrinus TaxID=67370 RepID=UPI003409B3B5